MADTNRDFKGVWIPKELYLAENLSWSEKLLLIEIHSLDKGDEKGCFASNQYLGNFLGIKANSIANMVSRLKSLGYLKQLFFDGRNRGLRVTFAGLEPSQKSESRLHKKVKQTSQKSETEPSQKSEHINTSEGMSNTHTEKRVQNEIPLSEIEPASETHKQQTENSRRAFDGLAERRLDSPFEFPQWQTAIDYAFNRNIPAEKFLECIDWIKTDPSQKWRSGRITPKIVTENLSVFLEAKPAKVVAEDHLEFAAAYAAAEKQWRDEFTRLSREDARKNN